MTLSNFIAYTTAGCLVWDIVLIYIGAYVGASWREVASVVHYLIISVAVAFMIVLALFLIRRKKNLKQLESSFSSRFD